jgi:hypothetical protein
MSTEAKPARTLRYKPPVESVADAGPTTLVRTALSLITATLAAMVLGSKALLSWANGLPISRVSDFVLYVAQAWDDLMTRLGITHYAQAIREFLHSFQRWH